jgi:hypothetical protein
VLGGRPRFPCVVIDGGRSYWWRGWDFGRAGRQSATFYSTRFRFPPARRIGLTLRKHIAFGCVVEASQLYPGYGVESREGLERWRWVVERTLGWLHRFRGLRVQYERRTDMHQAFLSLAWSLICWWYVER